MRSSARALSTTNRLSNTQFSGSEIPRWLWRLSWMLLAGALCFGAGGALILSSGAADPPYAGTQHQFIPISDLTTQVVPTLILPVPPYTIEASAIFPASAVWSFTLKSANNTPFKFELYDDGTYTIRAPIEVLRAGFIHLRGAGERMRIRIDVAADGAVVLRFNNEIAWRGSIQLSPDLQAESRFTLKDQLFRNPAWERFGVYFP